MTEGSPGLDHEVTCNMPYSFPPDVNELVCAHMSSGKYASEDELLRAALQALTEEEEDLAAVRESIGDPGSARVSRFGAGLQTPPSAGP